MIGSSGILWKVYICHLIRKQILCSPVKIGSDSNPKKQVNAAHFPSEWKSLLQSQGPVISTDQLVKISGVEFIESARWSKEEWGT